MSESQAKQLRRMFYGDMSTRERKFQRLPNGQIVAVGLRGEYQRIKKLEMQKRRSS